MKLKSLRTLIAFPLTLLISAGTYADGINVNVKHDISTSTVVLSGNSTEQVDDKIKPLYREQLNLIIVPEKMERESITVDDVNNTKVLTDAFITNDKGSFNEIIILPDSLPGGKYKAYINYKNIESSFLLIHINEEATKAAIQSINSDSNNISKIIRANSADLAIDIDEFIKNEAYIVSNLIAKKPAKGYNSNTFLKCYIEGMAVSKLKNSYDVLENILKDYVSYLGVDVSEYMLQSKEVKEEVESLMKVNEFKQSDFKTFFKQNLMLAKVLKADSYSTLKSLILNNNNLYDIDLSLYKNLKNDYYKDEVFIRLYKKNFKVYEDVKTMFDSVVSEVKTESEKSTKSDRPSNGGGSGNSGGGNGFTNSQNIQGNDNVVIPTKLFPDITDHWSKSYVEYLFKKEVLKGYSDGTFRPDTSVTRAEFSKMIVSLLGIKLESSNNFDDVSVDDWFSPYVNALYKANIVTGFDGLFQPNENIKREDAAVILAKALLYNGIKLEGRAEFDDSSKVSEYALQYVECLAFNNILNGYNNKISPKDNATRAEAATMLYKIDRLINK